MDALWFYTLLHGIIMWTRLVRHGADPATGGPVNLLRELDEMSRRRCET